jgi:chromosome segregation ATPase
MTTAELNAQLNKDIKQSVLNAVTSIKNYVDGRDDVLKSELTEQIVAELSKIDGLGSQLEKIKEMADAFSKVFDENKDGKITPEEILAKLTSLKSEIEKIDLRVDKVADDLLGAIDRIKVLEANVSKNAEEIAIIKQSYVKNEDLNSIKIDVKAISDAVNDILNPTTADSDGAVE